MTKPKPKKPFTKLHANRLLKVARALEESPVPAKFDMGQYEHGEAKPLGNEYPEELQKHQDFCGTPACALGHYAARRDLQRFLKVNVLTEKVNFYHPEGLTRKDVRYARMEYVNPTNKPWFGATYDDDAMIEHFGFKDYAEAERLFGGYGCGGAKTSKTAAKYIRRFVTRKAERYGLELE